MKLDNVLAQREFKTIYAEENSTVSVFRKETLMSNVLSEAVRQERAAELGFSAPKVIDVCKVDDHWAIVSEKCEGVTLYHMMKDNPEKTDEYIAKIIEVQNDMHKIESHLFRSITDKMVDAIQHNDISAVDRFTLLRHVVKLPQKNILCHCDLNPKNIVIADDGKYFVIDWKYAGDGNPLADITITYFELILQFDGETAEKFLNAYLAASGIARDEIEKWFPVCAAVIRARHQFANDDLLVPFMENYRRIA